MTDLSLHRRLMTSIMFAALFSSVAIAQDSKLEAEIETWGKQQGIVDRKRLFEYSKWLSNDTPKNVYHTPYPFKKATKLIQDADGLWLTTKEGKRVFISKPYTIEEE